MIEKAEHTLEYVSISKSSQTPKEPLYVDFENCIKEGFAKLAKLEKPQFTNVNEDFESERNDKITLLGSFYGTGSYPLPPHG